MDVLDHDLIAARYFFPRPDVVDDPFIVRCDDAELSCFYASPGSDVTMIHFHGNGETAADYEPYLAARFLDLGVNVLFAEYRGYGASTGEPQLGRMLDDVEAVFAAVDVDPSKTIVFGRSVGSIFAIELAHRHPDIGALILESGIADVAERLRLRVDPEELGVDEDTFNAAIAARLDHEKKLGAIETPLLVLHAENDHLVDVRHAHDNYAWSASAEKHIHVFPQGDHNSILTLNEPTYFEAIRDFLDEVM